MPLPKKIKVATRSTSTARRSTSVHEQYWYEDPSAVLVKFGPKDDLISLVRSLYPFTKRGKTFKGSLGDLRKLKEYWAVKLAANRFFSEGENHASVCDYNALKLWIRRWSETIITDG